jgi:hypothetical protein
LDTRVKPEDDGSAKLPKAVPNMPHLPIRIEDMLFVVTAYGEEVGWEKDVCEIYYQ